MRQIMFLVLGLTVLALGAQGAIRLLIGHDPGALRHLPGGFAVQLAAYLIIFVFGLQMARRNRVHPDPEHDRRATHKG
jgi:hypothetical protein